MKKVAKVIFLFGAGISAIVAAVNLAIGNPTMVMAIAWAICATCWIGAYFTK